jgi:hypothetical protein
MPTVPASTFRLVGSFLELTRGYEEPGGYFEAEFLVKTRLQPPGDPVAIEYVHRCFLNDHDAEGVAWLEAGQRLALQGTFHPDALSFDADGATFLFHAHEIDFLESDQPDLRELCWVGAVCQVEPKLPDRLAGAPVCLLTRSLSPIHQPFAPAYPKDRPPLSIHALEPELQQQLRQCAVGQVVAVTGQLYPREPSPEAPWTHALLATALDEVIEIPDELRDGLDRDPLVRW